MLKKPIVETVESNGQNDEEDASKSWENYLKRNRSIIVDLLVGQYKSTLICPDCKKISITFDPYMSVSLPLPNYQLISFQFYLIARDSRELPLKITFMLPSTNTSAQLKEELLRHIKKDPEHIQIQMIKDHRIIEEVKPQTSIRFLKEYEGIIFVYETYAQSVDGQALSSTEQRLRLDLSIMRDLSSQQSRLNNNNNNRRQ